MSKFLTISGRRAVEVPRVDLIPGQTGTLLLHADAAHPNKLKFKGILVRLDEPSTKPPQGSQGHLISLPSDIAAKQLNTLIGMGVNYAENLDAHDPAFKVGVIEKAWIKGNALWVSGFVWVGDFPDAEKVLSTPGMGMSMELTHVLVKDRTAEVWDLSSFVFTGATFLRKTSAAYFDTEAIAAAAAATLTTIHLNTEAAMPKIHKTAPTTAARTKAALTPEQKAAKIAASAATQTATEVANVLTPLFQQMLASSNKTNTLLEKLSVQAGEDEEETVQSASNSDEDEDEGDDDDWDEDDDEDEEDSKNDVDSANALVDAATEDGTDDDDIEDNMPGNLNPDAEDMDQGRTVELEVKQGPRVDASSVNKWKSRAVKLKASNKALRSQLSAAQSETTRLRARNQTVTETVKATAGDAVRKTLSASAVKLLSKSGLDAGDLRASGQVLANDEVDAMLRSSGITDVEQRMGFKLQLKAAGLMVDKAATAQANARRTA